ncbi:Box C/D snoRNA protein 1 [Trichinella zimbabwensis]|uniref:ubiquitinyl hydrolase 1 n=1 Tax=Trichinella zimbabwensis TaxID=268475 RepID=A0A0V1HR25_9BILA|nr:Box C/D snoRNA protein 1 [Trichinella zimbabwensis]
MFSNCESDDEDDSMMINLEELLNKKNNKPNFDNKHCDICKKNARYCCPACQARSCSLECVKKHKKLINCDGLACRTRFVPMQNYSTVNFMQDFNILMEAAGKYDHFRETMASYYKKHNAQQDRNLQFNCRSNGILLVRLPHYCYKNLRNKSFYNKRADTSFWSVEFIFHFNNNPVSVICDKIPNSLSLLTLLKNLFKPKPNSEFAEQSTLLNNYANIINLNDLRCFFKVEQNWWTKDDRYYAVDMNSSLIEILKDKIVVEFPTFHICQWENAHKFPIFDQAMKLAYLRSKVLLRKSDCADLSVEQILQMMSDDERIVESDLKTASQQQSLDDEIEDGELIEGEKVQSGRIKRFYPVDQGQSGEAEPKKKKKKKKKLKLLKSSEKRQRKQQMIANLAKRIVEQRNTVDKDESSSMIGSDSNETVAYDNYECVDYRSEGELSSSSTSSEANTETESKLFADYFNLGLENNFTNFSDHQTFVQPGMSPLCSSWHIPMLVMEPTDDYAAILIQLSDLAQVNDTVRFSTCGYKQFQLVINQAKIRRWEIKPRSECHELSKKSVSTKFVWGTFVVGYGSYVPSILVILQLKIFKMPDKTSTNNEEIIVKIFENVGLQQSDTEGTVVPVSVSDAELPLEAEPGFVGLYNLKNSCYMNCIIQVLCNTVEIKDFILLKQFHNNTSGDILFESFAEVIQSMWNGKLSWTTLMKFKNNVHRCIPAFMPNEEGDSSEFFNSLIFKFHEELQDENRRSIIYDTFSGVIKSSITCDNCQSISSVDEQFLQLDISFYYVIITFWDASSLKYDVVFAIDFKWKTVSALLARIARIFNERQENLTMVVNDQIMSADHSLNNLMNRHSQIYVYTRSDSIEYHVTLITSCVINDNLDFRCCNCKTEILDSCTICSLCLNAYCSTSNCSNSLNKHKEKCTAVKSKVSIFPRKRDESLENFLIRLTEESKQYVISSSTMRPIISTPHDDSLNIFKSSNSNCENSRTIIITWISRDKNAIVKDVHFDSNLKITRYPVKLSDLLNYYIADEQLQLLNDCTSCNSSRSAKKSLRLKALPKVLVFTIKRLVLLGRMIKYLHLPMAYPLQDLDMSPYLSTDVSAQSSTKYQLYGIVSNIQVFNHFIASVKLPATKNEPGIAWRVCDDKDVKILTEKEFNNNYDREAYMLFYRLQDDEQN